MRIADLFKQDAALAAQALKIRQDPDASFPVLSAKIKLTWRCNLKCGLCSIWRRPSLLRPQKQGIGEAKARELLTDLKARGLKKVHFSGGEVLLLDYFPDIVRFARGLGLQVNFTTNGTLLDKEIAKFLVEERVHSVTVSVDSGDESRHDKMRGVKGAWDRAWSGIKALRERSDKKGRGPVIAVNTIVTRQTVPTLDDLFLMLKENRVDRWRLLPVDSEDKKQRPTPEQWRELAGRWESEWQPLLARLPLDWSSDQSAALAGKGKYAGEFYKEAICFSPWFNIFIDADGLAFPCCMGKGGIQPYGNVMEKSLEELLGGRKRREVRHSMASGHLFPICKCCDDFLEENQAFCELLPKEEEK